MLMKFSVVRKTVFLLDRIFVKSISGFSAIQDNNLFEDEILI